MNKEENMIRLIFLALAAYVVYRLFANDFFRRKKRQEKEEQENLKQKVAYGEMAKDPECGAWVEIASSLSVREGSKQYYFCGYECRDKFLARLESGRNLLKNDEKDK